MKTFSRKRPLEKPPVESESSMMVEESLQLGESIHKTSLGSTRVYAATSSGSSGQDEDSPYKKKARTMDLGSQELSQASDASPNRDGDLLKLVMTDSPTSGADELQLGNDEPITSSPPPPPPLSSSTEPGLEPSQEEEEKDYLVLNETMDGVDKESMSLGPEASRESSGSQQGSPDIEDMDQGQDKPSPSEEPSEEAVSDQNDSLDGEDVAEGDAVKADPGAEDEPAAPEVEHSHDDDVYGSGSDIDDAQNPADKLAEATRSRIEAERKALAEAPAVTKKEQMEREKRLKELDAELAKLRRNKVTSVPLSRKIEMPERRSISHILERARNSWQHMAVAPAPDSSDYLRTTPAPIHKPRVALTADAPGAQAAALQALEESALAKSLASKSRRGRGAPPPPPIAEDEGDILIVLPSGFSPVKAKSKLVAPKSSSTTEYVIKARQNHRSALYSLSRTESLKRKMRYAEIEKARIADYSSSEESSSDDDDDADDDDDDNGDDAERAELAEKAADGEGQEMDGASKDESLVSKAEDLEEAAAEEDAASVSGSGGEEDMDLEDNEEAQELAKLFVNDEAEEDDEVEVSEEAARDDDDVVSQRSWGGGYASSAGPTTPLVMPMMDEEDGNAGMGFESSKEGDANPAALERDDTVLDLRAGFRLSQDSEEGSPQQDKEDAEKSQSNDHKDGSSGDGESLSQSADLAKSMIPDEAEDEDEDGSAADDEAEEEDEADWSDEEEAALAAMEQDPEDAAAAELAAEKVRARRAELAAMLDVAAEEEDEEGNLLANNDAFDEEEAALLADMDPAAVEELRRFADASSGEEDADELFDRHRSFLDAADSKQLKAIMKGVQGKWRRKLRQRGIPIDSDDEALDAERIREAQARQAEARAMLEEQEAAELAATFAPVAGQSVRQDYMYLSGSEDEDEPVTAVSVAAADSASGGNGDGEGGSQQPTPATTATAAGGENAPGTPKVLAWQMKEQIANELRRARTMRLESLVAVTHGPSLSQQEADAVAETLEEAPAEPEKPMDEDEENDSDRAFIDDGDDEENDEEDEAAPSTPVKAPAVVVDAAHSVSPGTRKILGMMERANLPKPGIMKRSATVAGFYGGGGLKGAVNVLETVSPLRPALMRSSTGSFLSKSPGKLARMQAFGRAGDSNAASATAGGSWVFSRTSSDPRSVTGVPSTQEEEPAGAAGVAPAPKPIRMTQSSQSIKPGSRSLLAALGASAFHKQKK